MTAERSGEGGGRLAGRRALVTGGSRGLGHVIGRRFAAEGAQVCLAATSLDALETSREQILQSVPGAQVTVRTVDVSDREACFRLVSEAADELGGVDVLVNAAGVYIARRFGDYTPEELELMMQVNLYGSWHLMQAVLEPMKAAGGGSIVNIASAAGKSAAPNQAAYVVAKHGVVGLTRSVATEVGRLGITVNAICSGPVESRMAEQFLVDQSALAGMEPERLREIVKARNSTGRFLDPEEIAALALYLASAESAGMTGQSLVIDGGGLFT